MKRISWKLSAMHLQSEHYCDQRIERDLRLPCVQSLIPLRKRNLESNVPAGISANGPALDSYDDNCGDLTPDRRQELPKRPSDNHSRTEVSDDRQVGRMTTEYRVRFPFIVSLTPSRLQRVDRQSRFCADEKSERDAARNDYLAPGDPTNQHQQHKNEFFHAYTIRTGPSRIAFGTYRSCLMAVNQER